MSEKFEPGDQVEVRASAGYDVALATVEGPAFAHEPGRVHVLLHAPNGYLDGACVETADLTLIARYADLVAEDVAATIATTRSYLATDTIDATQEAIDRVRASERQGSVEPEPPVHAQILAEAEALLVGDRQEDYGPPEVNFRRIADVWDVLVPKTGGWQSDEVALAMAGLKLARAAEGFKRDTAVDAAAYVALYAHLQKVAS